jgi:hypothetical protein
VLGSTLSKRTQQYVEALIREGEKFDHAAWLARVRAEEAAATKSDRAVVSDDIKINNFEGHKTEPAQIFAKNCEQVILRPLVRPSVRQFPSLHRPEQVSRSSSFDRRVLAVKQAWRAIKLNHRRNAIYGYLSAVFELVAEYRQLNDIEKLTRCASKLAGLPAGHNPEPFALIIAGTCGADVDRKTISRWSRALRYVIEYNPRGIALKKFMRRKGGVNACADKFARMRKRRRDRQR